MDIDKVTRSLPVHGVVVACHKSARFPREASFMKPSRTEVWIRSFSIAALCAVMLGGCSRGKYYLKADREVNALLKEK